MRALWLGRFQPPSIAHFATLLKLLDLYPEVRIAVVFNSPRPQNVDPRWISVLDDEDTKSHTIERNPFSPAEVVAMWNATIRTCGLEHRVFCESIMRPQYFDFNARFPLEEYALVATEEQKRASLKQEIFGRQVHHITPVFTLHNSKIKLLVRAGEHWQNFIAPGAWQVFHSLNGESRSV